MSNQEANPAAASEPAASDGGQRLNRPQPNKTLPTNRLAFEKHLAVLRAYNAASGSDQSPTTNADVAKIADISASSVSMMNPFLVDVGLITRDGQKQRPSQAVVNYSAHWEWNQETAAHKLAGLLSNTWFAKALLPKLGFRPLTLDEAVTYLAEESKASKDYKPQLLVIIEYLKASGLVTVDGSTVSKGPMAGRRDSSEGSTESQGITQQPTVNPAAPVVAPAPPQAGQDLHPFIKGLIQEIPKEGSWSREARARWLLAAANIFDLMFKDESDELTGPSGLTVKLSGKTLSIEG